MGSSNGLGPDSTRFRIAELDPDRTVVAASADNDDADRTVIRPLRVMPVPARAAAQPLPAAGAKAPGQKLALPAGFRLHEYRIDRLLGQGGFGMTYLASDVNLNARVAIKEYLPAAFAFRSADNTVSASSTRHRERYQQGLDGFLVEARTLATFRHPNIVRVARFFEAHQTAYMVLDYEHGDALKAWWPAHRTLPERELLQLLEPLLDGLAVVHAAGFLHRDIKPDNIYVRQDDGSLVLLDFGSARQAVGAAHSGDNALTPGYAPIEQYDDAEQGAWTDVYGLGATLYWMIRGQKPPEATLRTGAIDPMLPARDAGAGRYGEAFLAAIDWALQPRPQNRPQDVAQFRQALCAGHAGSLGLQEALRAGDTASGAADTRPAALAPPSATATRGALRGAARRLRSRSREALRRVASPASWPLAWKMTLAMLLTALLPMLITGWVNLNRSVATVSASELSNLQQLARSTAGRLSQLVGDSQHLATALGSDAAFVGYLSQLNDADKPAIRAKLASLVAANPDIHLLMVMDRDGNARVSSDAEVEGRNFKFREYFQAAMQGRSHASGIVVGAVAGAAGLFYACPVFDAAHTVIGAVVLRIKASSFAAILAEVAQGSPRTPFVVDADGVIVFHPDAKLLYSSLMPLSDAVQARLRADQRFRRDRVANLNLPELAAAMVGARREGYVGYRSAVSGRDEIAGYAPVQGHAWTVGVSEAKDDFEAPLARLYTQSLWSALLIGSVFCGLALLFARSIVRPLRALTSAAHALKSGDYARATVPVTTRDELGQLARTFNVMIDVLRQREREHTPRAAKPAAARGTPR